MKLYIETENGITKNHPALESNLIQVFGSIPERWEPFTRVERPMLNLYEVLESEQATYQKVNNVWTDVWAIRDMTTEEKTALQQSVIDTFNTREQSSNWSAWTLDEATCTMIPPIPKPEPVENKNIRWCGAENNWKELPTRPEGDYKFDLFTWQWMPITQE